MDFQKFSTTLRQSQPPEGLSAALQAMWYDGKGDWQAAHELAQVDSQPVHCWVHAYLHRKEGDNWNANYWYTKAKKPMPKLSLAEEWEMIVEELLDQKNA